jgi:hypothetical protein
MTDLVVRIEEFDGRRRIKLENGPEALIRECRPRRFELRLPPLSDWKGEDPNPVRQYGMALLEEFRKEYLHLKKDDGDDDYLRKAIESVVTAGGTLNFVLDDVACEKHSWEALCNERFLALGSNWSIGRLVDPKPRPNYDPSPLPPCLNVMAILAAAKISAWDEWEQLYTEAQAAARNGLKLKLKVLFAEVELIEKALGSRPVDNLELAVSAIPSEPKEIKDSIDDFKPHFLHFFCHGKSKDNIRALYLTDQNHFTSESTITLDIDRLADRPGVKGAWMVVFNACRGGAVTGLLHSFTHDFVLRGVPAAVGMMEEIDAGYAKVFCKSFYRAAFGEIRRVKEELDCKPPGEAVEIIWTEVLRGPRESLSEVYKPPERCRQWTLPILYVRLLGFKVRREAPPAGDRLIKGYLDLLPKEPRETITPSVSDAPTQQLVHANAWAGTGISASSVLGENWFQWSVKERTEPLPATLDADEAVDARHWENPKIGWGLLLPDPADPNLADSDRARAQNPDLQRLVEHRKGVVLRYRPGQMLERLRRYYPDGSRQDIPLLGTDQGIGRGELPRYILIHASPEEIPWEVQYVLAGRYAVGRLDLPERALSNYVDHVMNDWDDSPCDAKSPLIWTVDAKDGITTLMRDVIARPLSELYRNDGVLRPTVLEDDRATCAELKQALKETAPAMIVTVSHGRTMPLNDPGELRRTLGAPVDLHQEHLDPSFLQEWQPNGAIWYAHACCSAGSNRKSDYLGLFPDRADLNQILAGVAALGSTIAPLPLALLSAEKPARAFIGHVEPTFDWPLLDEKTRAPLASTFREALYNRIYALNRFPVGHAFEPVHREAGDSLKIWERSLGSANEARSQAQQKRFREAALRALLTGLDRQGVVVIGDPAVALPPTARHGRVEDGRGY